MSTQATAGTPAKVGRPATNRDDLIIRVERGLASKVRTIARDRGIPIAEVASELLRGPVDHAFLAMLARLGQGDGR